LLAESLQSLQGEAGRDEQENGTGIARLSDGRAMKAGTTSLADHMRQHSRIHMPRQEVHFFNNSKNYRNGLEWYSTQLLADLEQPLESGILVGEKTPAYCQDEGTVERIRQAIPKVKLLWIFREPVARTFSNYLHAVKKGAEIASFQQALRDEQKNDERPVFRRYLKRSMYAEQVRSFLDQFPRDQMHFMLFENFISETAEELARLASFLEIPDFPSNLEREPSNRTELPLSPRLLWLTRKCFGYQSFAFRHMDRLNRRFPRAKPRMPDALKEELRAFFQPHNIELADITGLDISAWG
jgi:hypothetical protein